MIYPVLAMDIAGTENALAEQSELMEREGQK